MQYDPFSTNRRFYGETDSSPAPDFFDTVGATLGYQYKPILDYVSNKIKYGNEVDPTYVSTNDMEGYEFYRNDLILAQNANHMKDLKASLDANINRRKTLAKSPILSQFAAGIFDPINAIALPFGGATIGIARSALRTGSSVATIQAGLEVARAPLDPLATPEESAINITSAFAAGAILGGAISIPATRRSAATISTRQQLDELGSEFVPVTNPKLPEATAERPFSQLVSEQLEAIIQGAPKKIKRTEEFIQQTKTRLEIVKSKLDEKLSKEKKSQALMLKGRLESGLKTAEETLDRTRKELANADGERITRMRELAEGKGPDSLSIAPSAWTDSVFYKFVTTPMKRVLQNKKLSDASKKVMLMIGGDSGILLNIAKNGAKLGASIYQKAQMRNGEWVQVHDELTKLYEREYSLGEQAFPDVDFRSKGQKLQGLGGKRVETYQEWISKVNRKRILGEKPKGDAESQAMARIDDYYKEWSDRLESVGMLGGEKYYTRQLMWIERDIDRFEAEIAQLSKTVKDPRGTNISEKDLTKSQRRLFYRRQRLTDLRKKKDDLEAEIQFQKDNEIMPPNDSVFNPRYWDLIAISENRDAFAQILFDWYKKNPVVFVFDEAANKYVQKTLSTKKVDIEKRVNETIDTILGRKDVLQEEQAYYGGGRSKHLRHRQIDIPNALVADFIETNPVNVMKAYNQRTASLYEFEAEFGRSIDDVIADQDILMIDDGLSLAERNAVLRDVRHMYDRVTTKVLRDPDSWDQTTATVLKDLAMLNYLGTAGLATLPDFAKIMMEHELGTVMKSLFGVMNDHKVRLSSKEARIAGEAIEILMGDSHLRLTEYMTNNPLNNGFMNKVRSGFFMLNGLAPMTNIFKKMDAIMRGHTLIDYSMKWAKGVDSDGKPAKITQQEQEYLLRYNIDLEDAKKIAESSWEKTEAGLYLPNTSKWSDINSRDNFRTAMNSGIMNTILMGTPADKPIAVDGVFYVPMHVAQRFGMDEDPKFRGYARIENGLLGLPFQFMSYSFAAANKITASLAQGQVRNRAVAFTASMGLGYMSLSLKQPDFVMDEMSFPDKLARSFDASGTAALYSDLTYTAMNTSLALGGPDIGMGVISPKFPQEKSILDAVTGITGAGTSYAVDVGRAVTKMATGEFDQGLYEFTGRLPFASALIWNEEVKELRQALRGGRY